MSSEQAALRMFSKNQYRYGLLVEQLRDAWERAPESDFRNEVGDILEQFKGQRDDAKTNSKRA